MISQMLCCNFHSVQIAASAFSRCSVKQNFFDELGDLIGGILDPLIPAEFKFVETANDTVIIVPDSRCTSYRDPVGDLHDLSLDNVTLRGFTDLAEHINTTRIDLEVNIFVKSFHNSMTTVIGGVTIIVAKLTMISLRA